MVSLRHTEHTDTHTHMYVYIDHVYHHSPCYHLQQQLVYFLIPVGPPAIAMSSFLFSINTQDKTQFHVVRNYRYHYTTSLQIEVIFNISMTKKSHRKIFHVTFSLLLYFQNDFFISVIFSLYFLSL